MKSVLISIQPYWVFLIIAKIMGWEVEQHKNIEVRKNFPQDKKWDKIAKIYCSKDRKSFNLIPKKYQPLMQKFLGKIIGEFTCDLIRKYYKAIPKYKDWWWTCTPWAISSYASNVRGVHTSGVLGSSFASNDYGVVPACILDGQTLISCDSN